MAKTMISHVFVNVTHTIHIKAFVQAADAFCSYRQYHRNVFRRYFTIRTVVSKINDARTYQGIYIERCMIAPWTDPHHLAGKAVVAARETRTMHRDLGSSGALQQYPLVTLLRASFYIT
jgi:hypothetical protein